MLRSDRCEIRALNDLIGASNIPLYAKIELLKKKKKLKNEAGISTRAFPLESPSKKQNKTLHSIAELNVKSFCFLSRMRVKHDD